MHLASDVVWDVDAPWFGGFSGLEMNAGGSVATLITDKGSLVRARLFRDADGHIKTASLLSYQRLKAGDGTPLTDTDTDAEGLAVGARETVYISFEQDHRVTRLTADGRAVRLPALPRQPARQPNKGVEALAIHPDGSLYALSETRPARNRPFELWRLTDGIWTVAGRIPRAGLFVPVGADIDRDGKLFILERAVTPLGFSSRVRWLNLNGAGGVQTLITTGPGRFGNLEGLSVWTDTTGATRLTLIADDNFTGLLHTQFVEYTLR